MKPGPKPSDPLARFDSKLILGDPNGCWLWGGHIYRTGYSMFYAQGKAGTGHRFAYEAFVGPIPVGMEIDHLCRVRHCVNPAHLETVTRAVNLRRKLRRTHCAKGHELADDNLRVEIRRDGSARQVCVTCARAASRARTARYRARKQSRGSES